MKEIASTWRLFKYGGEFVIVKRGAKETAEMKVNLIHIYSPTQNVTDASTSSTVWSPE